MHRGLLLAYGYFLEEEAMNSDSEINKLDKLRKKFISLIDKEKYLEIGSKESLKLLIKLDALYKKIYNHYVRNCQGLNSFMANTTMSHVMHNYCIVCLRLYDILGNDEQRKCCIEAFKILITIKENLSPRFTMEIYGELQRRKWYTGPIMIHP